MANNEAVRCLNPVRPQIYSPSHLSDGGEDSDGQPPIVLASYFLSERAGKSGLHKIFT